ncbi:MAG: S41 family peptidase [Firmicutes bacterium]|nr:S41 family peptidase [Bacillota bacterium]
MEEVKDKEKKKTTTRRKKVESNDNIKEKVLEEKENKKVTKKDKKEENKSSTNFNLIEVIIIMIITAVFGILIGSCVTYFRDDINNENVPDSFKEFVDVYNDLVSEYYFDLDESKLIEAGIKGMLQYLDDPHSSYLDYDDSSSLNLELEGEYVGMGATITVEKDGYVYISDMFVNSPAANAGFKVGDRIIAVDGEKVTDKNAVEVSYKVKGQEGTGVDITIVRDGVEQTIRLIRAKVEIPSVSYKVVKNTNTGYIKIDIFAKNTPEQFKRAMNELNAQGVDSLIIDVRDNSGGYLSSAEKIISYFLDKGDIIYQLDSKGVIEKVKNTNEKLYDLPVAVITNKMSASASEILAISLKENIDAVLIGQITFGKGTVQKAVRLESGAMIKYTIQEWLSPNGNKINLVGVKPDYEVGNADEHYDAQVQKAVAVLKNNKK